MKVYNVSLPGHHSPLAVVTGASSGIGAACARMLAGRRFRTLLIARRADRLEALARSLSDTAPSDFLPRDLADPTVVADLPDQILRQHGPPALLLNNAGFGNCQPVLETTDDELARILQVNFLSALALMRGLLPAMIDRCAADPRARGQVINIASISIVTAPWGHGIYAAAKAALVAVTQSLAAEHADSRVAFSCVNPGIIDTEFFDAPAYRPLREKVRRHAVPPERVARAVARLLDRPRPEVTVPSHYRAFAVLRSIFPARAARIVAGHSVARPVSVRPRGADSA